MQIALHMNKILSRYLGLDSPRCSETATNPFLASHIETGRPLSNPLPRYGSDSYYDMMDEAYRLHKGGSLKVAGRDQQLLSKLTIGKPAIYQGKKVKLDSPKRNPSGNRKKFYVYVDSGREDAESGLPVAKKIQWGDPDMKIRNYDEEAAASFQARHQCSTKNDKTKPGFWACHIHLFADSLGLTSDRPW